MAYHLEAATDPTDVSCLGQANHHMHAVEAMQAQEQLLRAELEGKQRHLVSVQAELARARGLRLAVAQAIQERVRQHFPDHRQIDAVTKPRMIALIQIDSSLKSTEDETLRQASSQLLAIVRESCTLALKQVRVTNLS